MSDYSDRLAAWQEKEDARKVFFQENGLLAVKDKAIYDHKKEGIVLGIAKCIIDTGSYNGETPDVLLADDNMLADAAALAASAGD